MHFPTTFSILELLHTSLVLHQKMWDKGIRADLIAESVVKTVSTYVVILHF